MDDARSVRAASNEVLVAASVKDLCLLVDDGSALGQLRSEQRACGCQNSRQRGAELRPLDQRPWAVQLADAEARYPVCSAANPRRVSSTDRSVQTKRFRTRAWTRRNEVWGSSAFCRRSGGVSKNGLIAHDDCRQGLNRSRRCVSGPRVVFDQLPVGPHSSGSVMNPASHPCWVWISPDVGASPHWVPQRW